MKRVLLQVYTNQSVEAVDAYLEAFNGTLGYHVRKEDGSYYHSEIEIEGHILSVAQIDDRIDYESPSSYPTMQFCFHCQQDEIDQLKHAYHHLAQDATILFPLGPTDYSSCCVDFIDRFGVRWCLFV